MKYIFTKNAVCILILNKQYSSFAKIFLYNMKLYDSHGYHVIKGEYSYLIQCNSRKYSSI